MISPYHTFEKMCRALLFDIASCQTGRNCYIYFLFHRSLFFYFRYQLSAWNEAVIELNSGLEISHDEPFERN